MTLTGIRLATALDPGSPEWLATISASQVATICGLTPPQWDSPYQLACRKLGIVPAPEATDTQKRGHELEPLVAAHLADLHPEWDVRPGGSWRHPRDGWATAAPDLLADVDGETVVVDIKTVRPDSVGKWRDGPPDYYVVQVMWQMHVTGARRALIAMSSGYELFDRRPRECWIGRDDALIDKLVARAQRLRIMLALGETPTPDLTIAGDRKAQRWQHPAITATDVVVPDDLAIPYLEALIAAAAADERKDVATAQLAAYVGDGKTATWRGTVLGGRRRVRGPNPPTFAAAKGLAAGAADLLNSLTSEDPERTAA